ncbi:hypothetical protein GLOIN_2v1570010 [Rhizophagus irregularis DAOM 181602=DAOM 197198]|uniref:Uncharacterized protein n=1 Tax=Rhizophagus irregularis (strain DAOM 181602 / DAOM 197198 / MUCL 43194) TaxID=747089 RepID=A0A2P4QBP6_RHIID|nr:hypothetical protein GLOIN_2v1570010 [Rhizophagus irregularis DAOM 181602=DAOM 197198]POG75046.1 hypothetical protein GLOIN_2v1570010 [Rhizophagus irregularis DAOM 181602=DAOM 197198]|eukprot:XP_025181912.1 hypothetical protein GLOIN_2v1570010 [Rhizophagus irregularis DAOM 181602=DAOM 197198]
MEISETRQIYGLILFNAYTDEISFRSNLQCIIIVHMNIGLIYSFILCSICL